MSLRADLAELSQSPRPPTNLLGPLGSCCDTQSQPPTASAALLPRRHPHRAPSFWTGRHWSGLNCDSEVGWGHLGGGL